MKLTDQYVQIARAGASLELSAAGQMTDQLIKIARALHPSASLRLTECGGKTADQLIQVARAAQPGQVIIANA